MTERTKRAQISKRRLRKQPKMRRVQSAHLVQAPKLQVSRTVQRRKLRNNERISVPLNTLKQILFSSRWISAGILALTIFALVLTGSEEDFYLTTIPVSGVISIPAHEIVAASKLAGAHIFAADPGAAAQNIMGVPGVISATVTLEWPNAVAISVAENAPVASWREGENSFWITQSGSLIPARDASTDLLVIETEFEYPELLPEPAAAAAEESAEDAAASSSSVARADFVPEPVLAGALQLRELRPEIHHLYYRPATGLSYEDGRGWRVYFGTGTDMQQKLVVYETIVADLLAEGLTPVYVSVSNQEKPYFRAAP